MQEVNYFLCPCCGSKIRYRGYPEFHNCPKCLLPLLPPKMNRCICSDCFHPIYVLDKNKFCCSNVDCGSFAIKPCKSNNSLIGCFLFWNDTPLWTKSVETGISFFHYKEFYFLNDFLQQVLSRLGYARE